jgi:hypothetical protein
MSVKEMVKKEIDKLPESLAAEVYDYILFLEKVISGIRNHRELKYPYGYYTKQHFQLCGQLFKGQKVHILRFIQGI